MKTVSFAKIAPADASAPSPAPAEENKTAPAASPAPAPANTNTQIAPAQTQQLANYEGADEGGVDAGDIRLPKLKLLQGTSDKKLVTKFGFGALLFKDTVLVARAAQPGETPADAKPAISATLVFVKLISKTYTEKVAKFGDPSGFARSLAEVEEQGGTTDWRQSKENPRSGGSKKPWYQVNANCLVLVEKPAEADDDHFPFEADGKFYAPALYSVKSFAYDNFFIEIATAKATGELRKGGYSSRFISLTPTIQAGKGNAEFAVPTVAFGAPTSEAVRAIAAELA